MDPRDGFWEGPMEVIGLALLAGLGAIVVLGLGLAAPAELGARLAHGRWLPLSLTVLWHVGWGWLHHPGHPMGGWPAGDRGLLPGAGVYGALLVLEVLVVVAAAAGAAVALVKLRGRGGRSRGHDWGRRGGPVRARGASDAIPRKQHRGL